MATIQVTTHIDEAFGGGTLAEETADGGGLSLREAVALAAAGDTITFDVGDNTLLRLTQGQINTTVALTIDGGEAITITGDADGDDTVDSRGVTNVAASTGSLDDNSRIFFATANLTLDGLTLTGGRTEGDSSFSSASNQGGAIHVDGTSNTLTITNSTIEGNSTNGLNSEGGAIYADGDLAISNSTIARNYTEGERSFGGAIYAQDTLSLANTTVAYNETQGDRGYGGAIFANSGTGGVFVFNSTIVGNQTLGQIDNNTSFKAGSAIYSDKNLYITNSIVLNNTAADPGGSPQLQEKNASGQGDGAVGFFGRNIVGSDTAADNGNSILNADVADVFIGGLRDNGGPVQTIALTSDPSNPALDAADGTTLQEDARGVNAFDIPGVGASSGSALRDIGAFELNELPSLVVTTTEDVVTSDGETSLREAIAFANAQAGADTITFAAGGQGLIRLTQGEIEITDELTIQGGGAVTITGDANGDDITTAGDITDVTSSSFYFVLDDNSRIFRASDELVLDGLTLTGGRTTQDRERGGAVDAYGGTLTIRNSTISGNTTEGDFADGGAVYSYNAVSISNSTISGNSTTGIYAEGGGVYSYKAVTIANSTISGNLTFGDGAQGGGVYSYNAVTIKNSTISGNETLGDNAEGGGVFSGSDIAITNSTISGNATSGDRATGGAVYSANAVTLTNSTVSDNATSGYDAKGGAIATSGALEITGSTISGNSTNGQYASGGGVFAAAGVTASNSTFYGNRQYDFASKGGAIYSGADLDLSHVTILNNGYQNSGNFGGGAYFRGDATVANSLILGNVGSGENGDLSNTSSNYATLFDVTFQGKNLISSGAASVAAVIANVDAAEVADVFDGSLADNGGPVQTIALKSDASNPALDATDGSDADARGFAVFDLGGVDNGGTKDLGAFELQSADVTPGDPVLGEPEPEPETGPTNGNDVLVGTDLADTISGLGGDDTITGLKGDDLIFGGADDDLIKGGGGADRLRGGGGSDTLNGGGGADNIKGKSGADTLKGGSGKDLLNGGSGKDTLFGGSSNDTLKGKGGNDKLRGDKGKDTLDGGSGKDNLKGGGGNDTLKGGKGADTLKGGGGKDKLSGGNGADTLNGGSGKDTLDGGRGNDTLKGGGGKDTLDGGAGKDKLTGGAGTDIFRFDDKDSGTGGKADKITDFTRTKDTINLKKVDADTSTGKDDAFVFTGQTAAANSVWYETAANGITLMADVDGDQTADLEITLTGVSRLTEDDLIL